MIDHVQIHGAKSIMRSIIVDVIHAGVFQIDFPVGIREVGVDAVGVGRLVVGGVVSDDHACSRLDGIILAIATKGHHRTFTLIIDVGHTIGLPGIGTLLG